MAHFREPIDITTEKRHAPPLLDKVVVYGFSFGGMALAVSFVIAVLFMGDHLRHFAYSYLVNFTFFLSLSLGALFFVILHHLTRAGWSVTVRRIAEMFAHNFGVLALLALPVLILSGRIFPWAGHGAEGAHGETHGGVGLPGIKGDYLNFAFFLVRVVLYFAVWAFLSNRYYKRSIEQDQTGDPALTLKLERLSPLAIILFAFTVTFAAFDFLMSLSPNWYSTIFGVYFFSGCVVGFLSLLAITAAWLQHGGYLRNSITVEHYHDVGKLMFAFVMFWAYIAYSQYMLIWYGNIPEETAWYHVRQSNGWGAIGLLLLFGHFILPFAGLMSRHIKRRKGLLVAWAAWLLVLHYVDLYWLSMPALSPGGLSFHPVDAGLFVGVAGLYLGGVALAAKRRSLVPERDPRLPESLAFENL